MDVEAWRTIVCDFEIDSIEVWTMTVSDRYGTTIIGGRYNGVIMMAQNKAAALLLHQSAVEIATQSVSHRLN